MLRNARLIIVFSILVVSSGCGLFSSMTGDEVIYAPTEVGTPAGDKVTKDIGPAGGTLSSPDGRLTLTVPPNAVNQNIGFSIQPISNKTEDGVGFAYRLEPSGKSFNAPLLISLKYSEQDIEGTRPEALEIAYQAETGAWREQSSATLDTANSSVTVSTKHLSDWALYLGNYIRIVPSKAKVRVSDNLRITVKTCEAVLAWFVKKEKMCKEQGWGMGNRWTLKGPGKLTQDWPAMVYTAPAKQPKPNEVTVIFNTLDYDLESKIIIIGEGYRVSGQGGDEGGLPLQAGAYSGVICSLEKPFTIYASANNYDFKFTPSSESNGTWAADTSIGVVKIKGSGTYSIENIDSDKPRIKVTGTVTGSGPSASGTDGGTHYFDLTPLDTDECGEVPPTKPTGWGPPELKGKGPF